MPEESKIIVSRHYNAEDSANPKNPNNILVRYDEAMHVLTITRGSNESIIPMGLEELEYVSETLTGLVSKVAEETQKDIDSGKVNP